MVLQVQAHQHHYMVSSSHGSTLATLPFTLDLFHDTNLPSSKTELENPSGWQEFLNLETGEVYYIKNRQKMSRRNGNDNRNGPKLDLNLNLSTRPNPRVESPSRSATVSPTSPPSSCVSSELNQEDNLRHNNSPEGTSMVLVGCPRCLMYVMLSEDDPKCPKCKSTVLLDFLHENSVQTRNS